MTKLNIKSLSDMAKDSVSDLMEKSQKSDFLMGISTGYDQLDAMLGGFMPGTLVTIGGRTGMGKTTFAINVLYNLGVRQHTPCLWVSLEATEMMTFSAFVACALKLDSRKLMNGMLDADEWEVLDKGLPKLLESPIFFENKYSRTIDELCETIRNASLEKGIKVAFVDYLQLIFLKESYTDNRYQELNYVTRRLKALAKELDITIIVLSQLNRNSESDNRFDGHRPVLTDLRDSGTICDDSDVVCFVYRPDYYHIYQDEKGNDLHGQGIIIIAKNRFGITGDAMFSVDLSKKSFVQIASNDGEDDFGLDVQPF